MAYAQAFLTKEKKMMFPLEKTDTLKSIFKYVLIKATGVICILRVLLLLKF